MSRQIGAAQMRKIGKRLEKELPGLGYALFVFEFFRPGVANYISNAQRADMIKALEETLDRLKGGQDFKTPEEN
jgi:hypothetical protein